MNMTAEIGETVTLRCRTTLQTPVDWYHRPSQNAKDRTICAAGNIINGYSSRFALQRSAPGDFSLIVVNVIREDAGWYTCAEDGGYGLRHEIKLIIRGELNIVMCYI